MLKRLVQFQSPLIQKIIHNLSWSFIGQSLNMLITLTVGIYVARFLGPEQYGMLNYVVSFVLLFSVFANFSSDEIIVKMFSVGKWPKNVILKSALIFRLLFSLLTIGIVVLSAFIFEADPFFKWSICLYTTLFIAQSFDVFTDFFVSEMANKHVAKSMIIKGLGSASIKITLMILQADLIWFVVAAAFDFYLLAISLYYFFRRHYTLSIHVHASREVMRKILQQSLPLMLTGVAIIIYDRIDQIMIKNMIGATQLGYYAVGLRIISIIFFVPKIISQTLLPVLVSSNEKNSKTFDKQMQLFSDIMIWITILLSILFSLFGKQLVAILLGDTYDVTGQLVRLLSWKSLISAFSFVSGQWIIIKGLQRFAPYANGAGAILNVGLNFVLIPVMGIWGALVATFISYSFAAYFFYYFIPELRPAAYIINRTFISGLPNLLQFGISRLSARK